MPLLYITLNYIENHKKWGLLSTSYKEIISIWFDKIVSS